MCTYTPEGLNLIFDLVTTWGGLGRSWKWTDIPFQNICPRVSMQTNWDNWRVSHSLVSEPQMLIFLWQSIKPVIPILLWEPISLPINALAFTWVAWQDDESNCCNWATLAVIFEFSAIWVQWPQERRDSLRAILEALQFSVHDLSWELKGLPLAFYTIPSILKRLHAIPESLQWLSLPHGRSEGDTVPTKHMLLLCFMVVTTGQHLTTCEASRAWLTSIPFSIVHDLSIGLEPKAPKTKGHHQANPQFPVLQIYLLGPRQWGPNHGTENTQ